MILSEEAMATHSDCVAGYFNGKHLILLNVVVNRAAMYIHDFSRRDNPDHFDVFLAAPTPDFVSSHERRLHFRHIFKFTPT